MSLKTLFKRKEKRGPTDPIPASELPRPGFALRFYPDPILKEIALPYSDEELKDEKAIQETAQKMALIMLNPIARYKGVGLAAPQVGLLKRIFILSPRADMNDVRICVNPQITGRGREIVEDWEGCLSYPGAKAKIKRSAIIEVRYFNSREWVEEKLKRFEARIFQHELDHLDGVSLADLVPAPPPPMRTP